CCQQVIAGQQIKQVFFIIQVVHLCLSCRKNNQIKAIKPPQSICGGLTGMHVHHPGEWDPRQAPEKIV
ncbi:MAG: hypothetical protein AMJ61_10140, partial [Desulfobacterales bacterium SG8_35_2]